ncbi:TetR/AcrR family transcriptional regulator [Chenggangzhangella methanolivorans]|uniref:TetR/AcrR family transcriptional regulator n=2 Tax=Chenggangzhangella methanolivorans TaxID=1437009 RepID=A0A9E6RCF7_9HYPH|nr:TetR/AcrR family transcriptional regulator [Chenggangzhangella methanolivorans]
MTDAAPAAEILDRRKRRGAQSRQRVLEHAAAIASVDGLEGLTIGRLAAEAGVAKGNIQVLFGDKQSLQLATVDFVRAVHVAAIVEPALAEASPVARLRSMVERWFDFVEARELPGGCFMNAVASEFRARPGAVRDRVAAHRADKRRRYVEAIREGQAAGEIDADANPGQLTFELLAFQALANVAVTIGDDAEFEQARASSLALLDGVTARRSGQKAARPSGQTGA